MVEVLRRFADDPVGTARLFGRLTGQCCFCCKALSNPPSVNAGYGPYCASKYGLPWGGLNAATEREVFLYGSGDGAPDTGETGNE